MTDILLDRALQWIDRRLSEFDPLWQADAFDFNRGQRLGELAILARTAAQMAGRSNDPRVGRMAALLQRTHASPVYADRLLRAPIEFMLFLEGYATLRALGMDDDRMRGRLQKAIRSGWLQQTERFPHRAMDIRSCLDVCGIESGLPPLDELYRRSILGTPPNPILLHEHDLYALTHVVMFLCDFGMRPADAMPEAHRRDVAALLAPLTVVAARDRHWDLLAEFLLCWSCLDLPETGLIERGWETLERAQRADGAVPGPEAGPAGIAEPSFEHVYHTTLVSAVAASIRQGKAREPHRLAARAPIARPISRQGDDAELRDAGERSNDWLIQSAEEELEKETSSGLRLGQMLVGFSCCAALRGNEPPASVVHGVIGRLGDVPGAEWQSMPPLLQCVSAAWAAEAGAFVPALHGPDSFLRHAGTYFRHTPPATGRPRLEMNEIWLALDALRIAPAPPVIPDEQLRACGRGITIDSDADRLDDMLLVLDAATIGGTYRIGLPEEIAWLAGLVAGLAVDACRRYDLTKASDLIRTGMAIAQNDPCASRVLRTGIDYLVFNQREDGAFGFFGPELAARRRQFATAADDRGSLLPLTVTCLQTLAGYYRDWHVLTALGARASAVGAMLAPRPAIAPVHAHANPFVAV